MPLAEFPLAGAAAVIMAIGSMLGGVAAVITARNAGRREEHEAERLAHSDELGVGGGVGSPGGDSVQ